MKITKSELQKMIQEAINEALMSESNKQDDIDADRDDKVEDAKAELDKKIDDIDSDKDEKRANAEKDFEKKEDDADADKDEKEKSESLNESNGRILTTEEFLDWHDNKANYSEDKRLFDAIYEIFKRNGFTEDDDVDVCYDGLSRDDKIKVTDIIKSKYTLDEGKKKSVGQELKDDQEWIDYDMKHDHHISKATQKDIEDQGLQIEKDQYGDYEVTAGHYDEDLNESYEDTAEDLKIEVQRLLPDDYAVVVVPADNIRTDDKDHENEFTGEILPKDGYDYDSTAEASVNIVPNYLYSKIMDNFDYDEINDEIGSFTKAFDDGWVKGDPDCFIAYVNLKNPQFICYDDFNSNTYKDVYLDYKDFKDFAKDIVDRFNK